MKYLWIIIAALCGFTACTPRRAQDGKPQITVTIEPLRYFTEAIAGDRFTVTSMVPKGSSPETYDPTPQQLVALDQSVAYLRIGYIGFEQAWMDKLTANVPSLPVYDTSRGVDLIHETASHAGHRHEGGVEPHIWNSAHNAGVIAANVCEALCDLDAAGAPYFRERLDSLRRSIDRTDREVRALLQHADSTFLIYHPALSYFARDYGLHQISIEEGGKEPSPARLKELIEECRRRGGRVIFVQQEFDMRNARLIADELGATMVPINPLSYDWEEEMMNVARALGHEWSLY